MKTLVFAGKCFTAVAVGLVALWVIRWHRDHPSPTQSVAGTVVPTEEPSEGEIKDWMKLNLADPEASIVEMAPVQVVLQDKVMCVRIRARNALGGWVMEDMVFLRNVERKVTGARLADYAKRIVSEAKGEDMGLLNAQLDLISGARK